MCIIFLSGDCTLFSESLASDLRKNVRKLIIIVITYIPVFHSTNP